MSYSVALIVPLLSFFLQVYPRFFNKYYGVDFWRRMMEADLVRKNGHQIPKDIVKDGFLVEGYFDNPPIFPWILSFIPKKTLIEVQGFIAPIFDSLQNLLVFMITFQLTGRIDISVFAQLIYGTIPLTALENSYLTPRSLGYLDFTLAFYSILLYSVSQNSYYLIAAFVFTSLVFLMHRFAMQSLLFIILLFTFIDRTFVYLLIYLAGFITALVITRGYYLRALEAHFSDIYFWTQNYKYRFAHQVRGFSEEKKKMDFSDFIYFLLTRFAPLSLIGTNLWMLIPFFLILTGILHLPIMLNINPSLTFRMIIWVAFFYVIASLVLSIKRLIPIGEGQRYLEMATVPTSVLSSLVFFKFVDSSSRNLVILIYTLIFLFNLLSIIYSQVRGRIKDKNRSLTKDMGKVFKFINKSKPTPRILCIPHQSCGLILFNTHAKVLSEVQFKDAMKIRDVFPILRNSVQEIAKKHNLNMLFLKKTYATMKELHLKKSDMLLETEDAQLFRIG